MTDYVKQMEDTAFEALSLRGDPLRVTCVSDALEILATALSECEAENARLRELVKEAVPLCKQATHRLREKERWDELSAATDWAERARAALSATEGGHDDVCPQCGRGICVGCSFDDAPAPKPERRLLLDHEFADNGWGDDCCGYIFPNKYRVVCHEPESAHYEVNR